MMFVILPNMIEYKLLIKQLSSPVVLAHLFHHIRKISVMIKNNGKITNFIKTTRKTHQRINQDQQAYHSLVLSFCILRQVQVMMVLLYLLVGKELILYKNLI